MLRDVAKTTASGAAFDLYSGRLPSSATLKGAMLGAAWGTLDIATTKGLNVLLARPGGEAWLRSQMTSQGLSPTALAVLNTLGRGALPLLPTPEPWREP